MKTNPQSAGRVDDPCAVGRHAFEEGRCRDCGAPAPNATPAQARRFHEEEAARSLLGLIRGLLNLATTNCTSPRLQIASAKMDALLANPQYEPARQDGESAEQAYARRSFDYADALLAEHSRREGNGKEAGRE